MFDQAESLRRLTRRTSRPASFAVVGAEGSGGSTAVSELAMALARAGQRPLLLDTQHGQVQGRRLGLSPTATLSSQSRQPGALSELMNLSPYGITLLNLYARPDERSEFSKPVWQRLQSDFRSLERDADVVLIDAPPPAEDPIPAGIADNLLLVLSPDAESLTRSYADLKRLHGFAGRLSANVLINRCDSLDEARRLFNRLAEVAGSYLQLPLRMVGFVPYDISVPRSQTLRRPLIDAFPHSEAAIAFGQLASQLPNWHTPPPGGADTGYLELLASASCDCTTAIGP
jgi:flagellar biosynthesis protein FlhG